MEFKFKNKVDNFKRDPVNKLKGRRRNGILFPKSF